MTNYEKIKNMSKEEFVEFLDKYGMFDESPWVKLFDKKYCKNCEAVEIRSEFIPYRTMLASWCELHDGHCEYFPDKELAPDNKEMIEMWLNEECGK